MGSPEGGSRKHFRFKLVGRMLENQMRMTGGYWRAFARWKKIGAMKGIEASGRLSREEAHERR